MPQMDRAQRENHESAFKIENGFLDAKLWPLKVVGRSVGLGSHEVLHRFVPSFVPSASVLQHAAQWVQLHDACVGIPQAQHTCIVWGSLGSGMSASREMPGELVRDKPVPAGFCMVNVSAHFTLSSNIGISRCIAGQSIRILVGRRLDMSTCPHVGRPKCVPKADHCT